MNGIDDCTKDILQPELEGLNGVNRQPSNGQKINRQPSKTEYFYRQPSNERTKISRQISQQPRSQGLFPEFGAGPHS